MTSPRQRSEKPQRLSLHTVLLRRRWRAAHGLARILVRRIDAREGLISHYLEADFPGRSATFSIHLSLALSCGLHAVLGTAAGAGLAHLTAGLDMFPALLCGALLVLLFGLTTGISSWRRTAVFPFHELYRQAPLPEAALVRRLIRAEWLFAGLARSAAWALPGGWATVTIALAVGRGAGALTALPAVTVCLGLHALGFLAGCLLGSARARIRAERPDHLSRLALSLAAFGAAALAGWAFVQLTYGLILTSVWVAFPRAADVLDPTRWEALLVAVEADGGARLAGLTEVAAGALTHPRFAPALALLLAGALLSCVALLVLPRRLVATGRVSARRSPAVRAWVTALGAAVRQDPLTVVLLRRLHANDWIVGQTFWQRATLPIESGAYLGVAVALAQTAAHPGVVALVTTVASAFVLHNQAIETRTELAPISGVGADGAATVLLGQTPGRIGITRSVSARCALLRAQLIPAAVLTTVALLAITTRTGHAPQYAVPAVALVVVSLYLAPLVQWYMGPVLYLEAGHQRDEELGLDSAAESLQDALQGVPRQVLLVVPAFVALAGHLLGPYLPERAFLAVSGGVVALHVAAIPVLLLTSRTLRRRGRAGRPMSEPLVRGPERAAPTAPTDAAPRVRQPLRAAMIAAGSLAVAGFLAGVAVGWVTTPMDFTAGDLTPDPIGASARDIARNNLGVAAMILGLGMVTLAAAPAAILFLNGLLVGHVAAVLMAESQGALIVRGLLPHAGLEVFGFAAIAAASVIPGALLLGAALRLPRPETTGRTVRRFIATLAVGVAVLCIAAVIEDLVSTTAIGSVLS